MRIKSKFELNFVHIAVLAICPLLSVIVDFKSGMTIMFLNIISYLFSMIICLVMTKNANKNLNIFITALIAALVVVGYEMLAKNGYFKSIGPAAYYSILSTIILSIDTFFIDTKSQEVNYFIKAVRLIFVYSIIMSVYFVLKEFLSFGTISGVAIFGYEGFAFFETITFDFLILGLLCALINRITLYFMELHNDSVLVYNKYKTKIRNEKAFLYEKYRRDRLLTSEVIENRVGTKPDDDSKEDVERQEEKPVEEPKIKEEKKSVIKHKPRRKNKLKVSKEAKVERLFDRKNENKEDDE